MTVRKEQLEDGCYLDGIGVTSAGIAASQSISLKRIADVIEALVRREQETVDPVKVYSGELIKVIAETELRKRNAAPPKR